MRDTIADFGAQWMRYPENDGYYASPEMFADICHPLLDPAEVAGLTVADLGSGSGRIVNMLLDVGAAQVTAVEPSAAFLPLSRNTADRAARVRLVNAGAEGLPDGPYDLVVSIGVLHHIPDPDPAVRRAFACLSPSGRMLIWIYGQEGNAIYLALVRPLRKVTARLPDSILAALCHILTAVLNGYVFLCRFLPLPMHDYMLRVIAPYGWKHRFLTVFDQLNPAYAKYYSAAEARHLLENAGFRTSNYSIATDTAGRFSDKNPRKTSDVRDCRDSGLEESARSGGASRGGRADAVAGAG